MNDTMKTFFFASAFAVFASVSAFAGSITFTGSFGPLTTNFTTNTPLSQFDPSLGNLTSVVFSITGTSSGSETVTNLSGADDTYNVDISTRLQMRDPSNVVLTVVTPLFNDPAFAVANNTTRIDNGTSNPLTNISTITSSFAAYIGAAGNPGTLNFNVFATGRSSATGPTPSMVSATTSAFGTDSVTYNFSNPVIGTPEPATMGLLGSALVSLGFLRFRTKKS